MYTYTNVARFKKSKSFRFQKNSCFSILIHIFTCVCTFI